MVAPSLHKWDQFHGKRFRRGASPAMLHRDYVQFTQGDQAATKFTIGCSFLVQNDASLNNWSSRRITLIRNHACEQQMLRLAHTIQSTYLLTCDTLAVDVTLFLCEQCSLCLICKHVSIQTSIRFQSLSVITRPI